MQSFPYFLSALVRTNCWLPWLIKTNALASATNQHVAKRESFGKRMWEKTARKREMGTSEIGNSFSPEKLARIGAKNLSKTESQRLWSKQNFVDYASCVFMAINNWPQNINKPKSRKRTTKANKTNKCSSLIKLNNLYVFICRNKFICKPLMMIWIE